MHDDMVLPEHIKQYMSTSQTTQAGSTTKKERKVRNRRKIRIGQALEINEFD